MWINYQLMAVCPLILKFLHISSQNGLFLLIILASQTFYPNWPIFLHGYIRHIRDIFQLCVQRRVWCIHIWILQLHVITINNVGNIIYKYLNVNRLIDICGYFLLYKIVSMSGSQMTMEEWSDLFCLWMTDPKIDNIILMESVISLY